MSSTRPYFEAIARQAGAMPQARYVLPQFEERTAYGFKRQDPYAKVSRTVSSSWVSRSTTPPPTTSWPSSWSWSPRTQTVSSPCTSTVPADPSRR